MSARFILFVCMCVCVWNDTIRSYSATKWTFIYLQFNCLTISLLINQFVGCSHCLLNLITQTFQHFYIFFLLESNRSNTKVFLFSMVNSSGRANKSTENEQTRNFDRLIIFIMLLAHFDCQSVVFTYNWSI